MNPIAFTKKQLLAELLEYSMVMITVDATIFNVVVPKEYADNPALNLNLSWKFNLPMKFNDERVEATLTFQGHDFICIIPWDAVWMMKTKKHTYLFEDAVPAGYDPRQRLLEPIEGGAELSPPRKGHLRLLH